MVKNGKRDNRQRYKCSNCGKQIQNCKRKTKKLKVLWKQYIWGKQTTKQLSDVNGKSIKWIREQLDKAPLTNFHLHPQPVVAIADATFWGRAYGVLVFRSFDLKQNLYWTEIKTETIAEYKQAREILEEELGFTFDAIVLDGKTGIKQVFKDIPVQHCQFHQIKTINKYLTRRPKLQAAIELRAVALAITEVTEEYFTILLNQWHEKWKDFLKERTTNLITNKWFYTHKRIRSAYRSLHTNLPYLFTYQKYPELHIPNTTNSLDGSFSHLKQLIGIHRGLTQERRWRLIQEVLAKSSS